MKMERARGRESQGQDIEGSSTGCVSKSIMGCVLVSIGLVAAGADIIWMAWSR
jgi:hypothetical protein